MKSPLEAVLEWFESIPKHILESLPLPASAPPLKLVLQDPEAFAAAMRESPDPVQRGVTASLVCHKIDMMFLTLPALTVANRELREALDRLDEAENSPAERQAINSELGTLRAAQSDLRAVFDSWREIRSSIVSDEAIRTWVVRERS